MSRTTTKGKERVKHLVSLYLKIDEELKEELRVIAEVNDRSMSSVVTILLESVLHNEPRIRLKRP